jgi:mannitol/fructose-specific phosphotransferase system IIA component (Ntr-type)
MEQNKKPSIVIAICNKVISANVEVIIVVCINANAQTKSQLRLILKILSEKGHKESWNIFSKC